MNRVLRSAALLILLLAGGCSSEWVNPEATSRSPRSVAVLPFLARGATSVDPLAEGYAKLLTRIVSGRLAPGPYLLLPQAEVQARLSQAGIASAQSAQGAAAEVLREILGVDMVVRGSLEEDAHVQAGLVYWRSLAYRVEAVDLRDGTHLLTLEQREVNLGGVLLNASQVMDGIEGTLESHSDLAFIRLAELLAEELVALLPAPIVKPEVTPPLVYEVDVEIERELIPSQASLGPESRLVVTLRGEPGRRASLRFSGGRAIPLPEKVSGTYQGVYRLAPGDRNESARVVLSDPYGAARVWPLELDFDLRAPAAPRELKATSSGSEVSLSWSPPLGDVSRGRYVVYAQDGDRRLVEVERTREPSLRLARDPSLERYFVAALSAAGVLGPATSVGAP